MTHSIIIIGSGFAGIAAAIKLQEQGIEDFLILERDDQLGGTWYQNRYPGAAVDVQSHLYSLSFETYDWSRFFAKQPEILAYTKQVIEKHQLQDKARTKAEVTKLVYQEANAEWEVTVNDSEVLVAQDIINASGGLSQPSIPQFEGQDTFEGKQMHTAGWQKDYNYAGKRVAVIGTGASGIQVIPALAPKIEQLYVFQRTPHWIIPRPDRSLNRLERKVMRSDRLNKWYRNFVYLKHEARMFAFGYFPSLLKFGFEPMAKRHIKRQIKDKSLRKKVTPDYTIGCKRILLSSNYYPALTRDNVQLLTKKSSIKRLLPNAIETIDGQQIEVDLIVYATGFKAAEDNIPYPVVGRSGRLLADEWQETAHAYKGTTVPYFPNFYLLLGPNTGIGHTSAIYMIEAQLEYIIPALVKKRKKGWQSIEIDETVEQAYNQKLQKQLEKTVWQSGGCESWYQNSAGKNVVLYPSFTFQFRRACANIDWKKHIID